MLLVSGNWFCLCVLWSNLTSSNGLSLDILFFQVNNIFYALKLAIALYSPLLSLFLLLSLFVCYLIVLVRTSNTILNNWYDNIYPCLLSISKDVNLTFHTMYDVCSSFWQAISIIYIKLAVSISHFLRGFYKSKQSVSL